METNIAPGLRFSILDHEFKMRLAEQASKLDLTVSQLRVLGELSKLESEGVEEINQKDLENSLMVTHPTMTGIIQRLEKKKAVICMPSTIDRRYKKVRCAPEYLHIHEELREMDWAVFRDLCKGIPQDQVDLFLALSKKMLNNIEDV